MRKKKKSKVATAIEEMKKGLDTVKKSPQAPKGKWRYGVVKRKYKTILNNTAGGVTRFTETCYELVEVYSEGKNYTVEAIPLHGSSVKELKRALTLAQADLEKYDVIVEKKIIVRDMRRKK